MNYLEVLTEAIAATRAGNPRQVSPQQVMQTMPPIDLSQYSGGGNLQENIPVYTDLMDAINEARTARTGYDESSIALEPLLQKEREYSTKRSMGLIPFIGEAIYDHFKRKKYEPQLQAALQEQTAKARGLDEQEAKVAALQQQFQQQQEQAEKAAEEARMAGLYQGAGVNEGEAALRAAGGTLPAATKQTSDVQNAIAMGLKPGTPEFVDYMRQATLPAPPQAQAPTLHDFVEPDGTTATYVMNPDGTPGRKVGTAKAAPVDEAQVKADEQSKSNEQAFSVYQVAMQGLSDAMDKATTGPIVGKIPAFTADAQTAEGAVAAVAPVLKQLFRVSGEGIFTDKDQALLLDMVPKRTDLPKARAEKLANIDRIVRTKLEQPGADTVIAEETKQINGVTYVKRNGQWYEAGN